MAEGKNETPLGTTGIVLPEFHYDLVARILPGVILLGTAATVLGIVDAHKIKDAIWCISWPAASVLGVIVIAGGYVCGMFLTWPQRQVRKMYRSHVWAPLLRRYRTLIVARQREISLENMQEQLNDVLDTEQSPKSLRAAAGVEKLADCIYEPLHDLLKRRNPQAQVVLPKMNAESGLFDQLCVGFFLISLILIGRGIIGVGTGTEALLAEVVLLVGAVLSFFVARYRYDSLIRRHFAYWSTLAPSLILGVAAAETHDVEPAEKVRSENL